MFGSELEFYLLRETYAEAHAKHYRDLTPSVPYILDYHILASTYDEPFIRQIRNGMHGAGIRVETSKGEAWPGQHEINFRYADALTMADNHMIYKNGAKEIAHLNGCSITFMAKPDHTWIGNSCHIHAWLWKRRRERVRRRVTAFKQFLAGPDRLRSRSSRSSSRRRSTRTSATRREAGRRPRWRGGTTTGPAAFGSSGTARRCGWRRGSRAATSTRTSRSRRCSPPGCTGSRTSSAAAPLEGNAYVSDAQRFPHSLREAIDALEHGDDGAGALGDDVVDHYLTYARTEQRLFDEVVTCYERERMFERG